MRSVQRLELGNKVGVFPEGSEGFPGGLSPDASKAFDAIKLGINYPSGSVLFIEGEASRGVFVLSKGRVKLSLTSPNGKVMILRIAKPGEILGLHAVISRVNFQATAETLEPCQIDFVRGDDFLRFLRQHPQVALLAARQLSASYQETCQQLRALGLSASAREKVARFLVEWSESGEKRKGGIQTRLTLTHEEIGQLIGTSRETITRILGDFRERRWIAIRGSVLQLYDKVALEDLLGREELPLLPVRPSQNVDGTELLRTRPYLHPKAYPLGVRQSALRG
ncbi:MAG TPA: Crp/Fnr family transcriptional regulator [Terriglobia bacterium]|nr:Crp/Fnr family transcriptional regulator [Terriglobia bacterium]